MKKSGPIGGAISPHYLALTLVTVLVMIGMPDAGLGYNGYGDGGYGDGGYGRDYGESVVSPMEITVADDNIVAFKSGTAPREIALLPGEAVRDVQVLGRVGAVITSERMLAISTGRSPWSSLELNPGETTSLGETSSTSYLSEDIVLFVTAERGVVFDPELNRFVVFDIPIGERVIAQAVYADVAVFVTSDRTVGYRVTSGNFTESSFSIGEIFRELKISAGLVSVITSDRVRLFQGPSAQWMEWTE